jgi:hypothetical protein
MGLDHVSPFWYRIVVTYYGLNLALKSAKLGVIYLE